MNTILQLDQEILLFLNGIFARSEFLFIDKFFAEYLTYTLPIILLVMWFYKDINIKKAAIKAFLSAILAWPIFAYIIGHIVKRDRPFEVGGIQELLFHRPTYSFPSDHAAALFAVAASFWFSGYKKLSIAMFALASVVSFFRVATGLHFPTDILAGIFVGVVAATIIQYLDKYFDKLYDRLINSLKKVKLA